MVIPALVRSDCSVYQTEITREITRLAQPIIHVIITAHTGSICSIRMVVMIMMILSFEFCLFHNIAKSQISLKN